MWLLYLLACSSGVDQQAFDTACEEGQADGSDAGAADRAACTDEHAEPASEEVWERALAACSGASAKTDTVPRCEQSFMNGYRSCYLTAYEDAVGDGCDTGTGA